MATQDSILKKPKALPTAVVRPTFMDKLAAGPRAFGGLPNTPDKGSPMARADAAALRNKTNVLGLPVTGFAAAGASGGPAAPPAPAAPSMPLGTRIGAALRRTRADAGPIAASEINTLSDAGTGFVNQLTAPLRYGAGLGEDVRRAYNGQAPRPDAGASAPGIVAPQLSLGAFDRASPNDAAAALAAGGRAGGVAGGVPSTFIPKAGTAAARGSVAGIQALEGVAPSVRPFLSPLLRRLGGAPTGSPAAGAAPAAAAAPAATITPPPAAAAPAGGVDIGGRHLNVGAMVNGVPTFSDGSGGGSIPRTMSNEQIAGYGDHLSRADAGALGGVLASDVTGAPVSTADRVATLVRNTPVPITGSRPTAQQFADADRINIATRDPRSAAGTAARNLAIDAQYGSPRLRRMAEAALAQLSAGTSAAGQTAQLGEQQQAAIGAQGAAELANTDARGRNALQAIQLQGANQLADTALTARLRPPEAGQVVQAEDGSYAVVDPRTAGARAVLNKEGKPLRGAQVKSDATTARANTLLDNLGKTTSAMVSEFQKNQALLPPDQQQAPPIAQFREQAARAQGLPVAYDKAGTAYTQINGQWMPL